MGAVSRQAAVTLLVLATTGCEKDSTVPKVEEKPMAEELKAEKVTTFLMFEGKAEEAMNFYISLLPNSKVVNVERYGPDGPGPAGSVKHATFTLGGREFMCIDSYVQHEFTFTPAISLFVTCESEAEVDELFAKLSDGGQVFMPLDKYPFSRKFGWTADRYGVSWQLSLPLE